MHSNPPTLPIRGLIASAFVFSIAVNLLMLTGPIFMLQVYNRVLTSRSEETLVLLVVLVSALFAAMGMLDYARGRLMARVVARVRLAMDGPAFKWSILAPQGKNPNALTHLAHLQLFLTSPVCLALLDVLWTPLFLGVIFLFHPLLGWLSIAGGLGLVLIAVANKAVTSQVAISAQTASEKARFCADEASRHGGIISALAMQNSISARWSAQRGEALRADMRFFDRSSVFTSLSKSFRLLLQSMMLALGAYLVLKEALGAGAMIASSIMFGRALAPLEQIIGQWPLVQRASEAFLNIRKSPEAPIPMKMLLSARTAQMSAQSVSLYDPSTKTPRLAGISFDIKAGQAVGVIGATGSGKTTLAEVLVGLQAPTAGHIQLCSARPGQYSGDQLGDIIGYVPQNPTLMRGTIAENIARMAINPDSEMVVAAAKQAGVHTTVTALPEGYNTDVNSETFRLSGGEQQRIALARAMFSDPLILILDEPNSALDAAGSDALLRTIRDFREDGKITIIMTHRPHALSECDWLIMMEQGRIVLQGPRDKVLERVTKNAGELRDVLVERSA